MVLKCRWKIIRSSAERYSHFGVLEECANRKWEALGDRGMLGNKIKLKNAWKFKGIFIVMWAVKISLLNSDLLTAQKHEALDRETSYAKPMI